MTTEEFLADFAEILDVKPTSLTPDTDLRTIETWDSVAYLSTMVLIDEKCGVAISPEVLVESQKVSDLLAAIGLAAIGPGLEP